VSPRIAISNFACISLIGDPALIPFMVSYISVVAMFSFCRGDLMSCDELGLMGIFEGGSILGLELTFSDVSFVV
jgi:hypothetical protein